MVPDNVAAPQFRAEAGREEAPVTSTAADHSDETMSRLRHPFDPQPAAPVSGPGESAAR